MNWLEVSLVVEGEIAEAAAEVLARFAPNGVVIESTMIDSNLESEGNPVGPLRVCAYIPMDAELETTRHRIEESLWYLGRIRPIPTPSYKPVREVDWAETWKKNFRPIPVGKRLIIVPAWLESPDETRIPIRIDPGMAFGTGTHPTTQLCVEMLEDYTPVDGDVFDIGCGSGILSIAAVKLGARRAYGIDIEADAVRAVKENAAANGVLSQVKTSTGSIDQIKSGIFSIRKAPLVLANILAVVLERLLDAGLVDLVEPGGKLILSGILEEQMPSMKTKIKTHRLQIVEKKQINDWVAIALQPVQL